MPSVVMVTTTSDASAHVGVSLRDAISRANSDAAGGISDTIDFAANLAGATISLTRGQLELSGAGTATITIDASSLSSPLAISGRQASRVLLIDPGVNTILNGVTIEGGFVGSGINGGGIEDEGTLIAKNIVVTGNSAYAAAGINVTGTLTLYSSSILNNVATLAAGGVGSIGGKMTIVGCTIAGNRAQFDGGIGNNNGPLTLVNSTIANNTSTDSTKGTVTSGGLANEVFSNQNATVNVVNCTFSGNTSTSVGDSDDLSSVWFSGSGLPTITLVNTILGSAGTTANPNTTTVGTGNIISAGHNLSTDSSGSLGQFSDMTNTAPLVGTLAAYGGPTQTFALQPNSPAIGTGGAITTVTHNAGTADQTISVANAGAIASTPGNYFILIDGEELDVTNVNLLSNTLTVSRSVNGVSAALAANDPVYLFNDQRGVARSAPQNIGASEFILAPPAIMNISATAGPTTGGTSVTITGVHLGTASSTVLSFGSTKATILSDDGSTLIATSPAESAGVVSLNISTPYGSASGPQFTYTSAPKINGISTTSGLATGGTQVVITGSNLGSPSTATIRFGTTSANILSDNGSTLVAVSPPGNPGQVTVTVTTSGGIASSPTLFIDLPAVMVTTASDSPGHSGISLRDAIAQADTAAVLGISETIVFAAGMTGITPSQGPFELNVAGTGTITIDGNNQMTINGNGAGVFVIDPGTHAVLKGLSIAHGTAAVGGGLHNDFNATLSVSNCTFSGNSATQWGGALFNEGTLTVSGSTFTGNSAGQNGGGIENYGTVTLTNSTFAANSASRGGAFDNEHTAAISNSTFSGNSASSAGGIFNASGAALTLVNTIIAGNTAGSGGGVPDLAGAVSGTSAGNLIGNGTGLSGITNGGTNANKIGTSSAPINPLLAPLGNYGGPTQTFALLPGSPALAAGGLVTTLTTGITATATSITVNAGAVIASTPGNFVIRIGSEQILVTNVTGNQLTVVRGYNGTGALPYRANSAVYLATDQRNLSRPSVALDIGALQSQTAVTVTDPNLAIAIRTTLGLPTNLPITTSDMARLMNLSVDGNLITSLAGLQFAVNLQSLSLTPGDLSSAPVRSKPLDLSPLTGLLQLSSLALEAVGLTSASLSSLGALPALQWLDLRYNNISSVAALATNASLQTLYVQGNPLTNVAPLMGKFIQLDLQPLGADSSDTIAALAAALNNNPLQIFTYVLNNVAYQAYAGSMKGPLATLQTGAGNDWDEDALLSALLQSTGIATQFVSGRISVDAPTVMNWLGVTDPIAATQVLLGAGLHPQITTDSTGNVETITFDHAWLQASMPLASGGAQWINLDPSWKLHDYQPGIRGILGNVPFNAAAQNSYLSQPQVESTSEWYENQVSQYLAAHLPGTTLADVPYAGPIRQQLITTVPTSLPYNVVGVSSTFTQIPAIETHRITIEINFGASVLLQASYAVPNISLDQINIDFSSTNYQNLAPQLLLNGSVAVQGTGPLVYGLNRVSVTIGTLLPGETAVDNTKTYPLDAGEYAALGLDAQQISGQLLAGLQTTSNNAAIAHIDGQSLSFENQLGPMLSLGIMTYFHDSDTDENEIAGLTGSVVTYYSVQTGMAESYGAYTFDAALQNPAVPNSVGPTFDIRGTAYYDTPIDNNQASVTQQYNLSAFDGSALENITWEKLLNVDSISTIKSLQLAHQRGIPVYTINSNSAGLISQLTVTQAVKNTITGEVQSGLTVMVPRDNTVLNRWTGVSWLVMNADGTSADFLISGTLNSQPPANGGSSGGVITPPPPVQVGTPDPYQVDVSDPVNVANGNVTRDETDISLPGIGLPLTFARHYDSESNLNIGMGPGWVYTYGDTLQFGPGGSTASITWVTSQGYHYTFTSNGSGGYTLPDTLFGTFAATSTGYQYRNKDGMTFVFDTKGRLVSETDRNGNTLNINHNANGLITTVSEADDPAVFLTFTFTSGLLTAVSDNTGRTWKYAYTAGRLTSVTAPANSQTPTTVVGYSYYSDTALSGLLASVTEPNGGTTHFTYYPNRRAFEVTDANGKTTRFSYNLFRDQTALTDSRGNTTLYSYNNAGNVTNVVEPNLTTESFVWQNDLQMSSTSPTGQTVSNKYDAQGNVIQTTDPAGNVTTYTYNATFNQIATITAPGGEVTQYAYDAHGNVVRVTDALGDVTTMTYDSYGQLFSQTSPRGNLPGATAGFTSTYTYDLLGDVLTITNGIPSTQSFTYDARGDRLTATDADGNTTTFLYDLLGRLVESIDANNGKTYDTYDAIGNLISTTDALGRVTHYGYNVLRQLIATTYADGSVQTDSYDATGNLIAQTDELGRTTFTSYDSQNRPIRTLYADGTASQTRYNGNGDISATIDQQGSVTQYAYDLDGRVISITDALGNKTTQTYDANGDLISVSDPLGRTTHYQYDLLNRQTALIDPLGDTTTTTYDADGNVISVTDPLGNRTRYVFDIVDRNTSVINALGQATQMAYDPAGNVISLTDPAGNTTKFGYDKLNHQVTESKQAVVGAVNQTVTETIGYDAVGNLISLIDFDGRTQQLTYDLLNRLTSEKWIGAAGVSVDTIHYSYDAAGELTAASDVNSSYAYTYNSVGQVASVNNAGTPGVSTVQFSCSYQAGNLVSVLDTINGMSSGTESFFYDALNRVTQISQSGNGVGSARVNLNYDAAGELAKLTRFADLAGMQVVATSNYTYDAAGRLTSLVDTTPTTTLAQYRLTLNSAGLVTQETNNDGTTNFTYDKTNQLIAAISSSQPSSNFSYDANGNPTSPADQTGADNRLLSDGTYQYAYDADGNLIKRTTIATGAVTAYTWDFRNRLTKVVSLNSSGNVTQEVDFTYDVFDQLIGETVLVVSSGSQQATVTRFVYDGNNLALQFDGSGTLTHSYLNGPGINQVLADANAAGQVLWYLADNLGSVRDVISSTGMLVDHLSYNSFGQITAQTNPTQQPLFTYTGSMFLTATGLQLDGARFYDPAVGRFISQDPTSFGGGDSNLYRYAGNDPINATDPTGLSTYYGSAGADLGLTDEGISSLSQGLYLLNMAELANASYAGVSVPIGYASLSFDDASTGFHANLFVGNGQAVLAFRGTDMGSGSKQAVQDWYTNVANGLGLFSPFTPQYAQSVSLAQTLKNQYGNALTIVGHSKGGGEAQVAGLITGTRTVAFNAAGLSLAQLAYLGAAGFLAAENRALITHVNNKNDILTDDLKSVGFNVGTTYRVDGGISPFHGVDAHAMDAVISGLHRQIAMLAPLVSTVPGEISRTRMIPGPPPGYFTGNGANTP